MESIQFQKWQGAGNDFIIIDQRINKLSVWNPSNIRFLCDRHFGIGADGLMLIEVSAGHDFEMKYYNSDGLPAEMCGNGGRCITAMAFQLGMIGKKAGFLAPDGWHEAEVIQPDWIKLKMVDVDRIESVNFIETGENGIFLNTGVPHLILFRDKIDHVDVEYTGHFYRNLDHFAPAGTNVNFVEVDGDSLKIRTYERGVEGETLACGTGNVAAAIATEWVFKKGYSTYQTHPAGGRLSVTFARSADGHFTNVYLEGPAVKVFDGWVVLKS